MTCGKQNVPLKEVPVTMTQPSNTACRPSGGTDESQIDRARRELAVWRQSDPMGRPAMLHTLQLIITLVLIAALPSEPVFANDSDGASFSKREMQGKIGYCTDCHGSAGQGYHGFYTMPRIAGQTPEYLTSQLQAFAERRRDGGLPIRLSRIHSIRPGLRTALANHFSVLNPKTLGRGPSEFIGSGKKIYQEGVPDSNIPACVACHGPQAQGSGPTARLAGQLYRYTRKQLANWTKGRGSETESTAIMQSIANNMTKQQIDAVAAYLNSLK